MPCLDKLSKCKNSLISLNSSETNWRKKSGKNSTVICCIRKHPIPSDYRFNLLDIQSSRRWKSMKKGSVKMLEYPHLKLRLRIGKEEDLMIFRLFCIRQMRISAPSSRMLSHKQDERERMTKRMKIECFRVYKANRNKNKIYY